MKKCKYHCDYGDGENCHYKGKSGCVNNEPTDNHVELGLEQPGATCDQCRWKIERHECPENYEYEGTDYAQDCDNFRNINWKEDAFSD